MDAFVLPSFNEDMPVVALEAQAAGLPVFISDTVNREVEITDTVKWLSLQQSPEIWADMILSVSECYERKSQLEAVANAGYDIRDTARVLEEVYKSVR
jgi:glycosyltransferase involved in cell wall biosynthesis